MTSSNDAAELDGLQPAQRTQRPRQSFPDQLRGIALLGILLVNAPFFALGVSQGYTQASIATSPDRAAAFLISALATGKFYLLFSFLFGYSANFILGDAAPPARAAFVRRLIALAVLGFLHGVFLFLGDILLSYAMLGAVLFFLARCSDRTVWISGAVVLGLTATAMIAFAALLFLLLAFAPSSASSSWDDAWLQQALTQGSFLEAAGARLRALPFALIFVAFAQWGLAFGAFSLGLVAGRHALLADLETRRRLWRRLAIAGLAVGVPMQLGAAWLVFYGPGRAGGGTTELASGAAMLLMLALAPIASAGYVGALALASLRWPRAFAFVQASGRASLTVYLGESFLMCVLFAGYGFALNGTLGAASLGLTCVFVWLALHLAMRAWFQRFDQGPLEAVLGRWTHRRRSSTAEVRPVTARDEPRIPGE